AAEVGRALEDLVSASEGGTPVAVRVTVTGRCEAHGELFAMEPQLRAEVLARIAAFGNDRLWLEKVKVETEPVRGPSDLADRSDAIAALHEFLVEAETDGEFLDSLQDELMQLVSKSPVALHSLVPAFESIRAGQVSELVRQVRPGLLAHLADAD
ncbi:MAG: DNA repair exonuclease, partial [Gammaproteobacteria bacterium]